MTVPAPDRPLALRRRLRLLALSLACAMAGACGPEGPYPAREVRLVVQASPGGISDTVSRFVARGLQDRLGVPVVAENRVGAAGSLAFSFVARSPADGYTIGYAPVDMTIIPHLGYSRVSLDDFDYLVLHTRTPAALSVRTGSPWTTAAQFVAAGKGRRFTVGTSGTGSIWHLAALAMSRATGLELTYVPFPGSSQAVTALLGGHLDAVVSAPAEVDPHVRAGSLRVLGVMAETRSPLLPAVPTFPELGYDVRVDAWGGFVAPRGLPADRRDRLADAIEQVVKSEDFTRFARDRGLEIDIERGPAFRDFARAEGERFAGLVRSAGLGAAALR